ncbi:class I SAM-dependent methyltransferase [Methylobacterium sp. J-078]|uniref:class I SAM-dependent methyltransferase n=1 Tax=Methylobacterium sp. J-078 TaxID=2836657 RepID=UPI001FBB0427|nr:class I SAM-dependent methyltransferase [Methylobacterium sp. J-078]MCJ2044865.1 class I SAM-dependent methyltransferase [Methylobacterium sp. J-078]
MYRRQRHLYDASRKFYLLGRDRVIADLAVPPGGAVLEIGCGTGRNLVRIARTYPEAACHGLDVSAAMLETAARSVARARLAPRIRLARGDATAFDPQALFGRATFDRIVISYALSMIPPWERVLAEAAGHLAPGGELHVVDFGGQAGLPWPVRALLNRWLAAFSVTPRAHLPEAVAGVAGAAGAHARVNQRFRGYCVHAVIAR